MRIPVRARVVVTSLFFAAVTILSLVSAVLGDTGPIPHPK
jgi:hypothetical protein